MGAAYLNKPLDLLLIFPFVSFLTTFPHATRQATGCQPQKLRHNKKGSAIQT
jgi:hypothetical protein